jgi:hypothetical protein
VGSDAVSAWGKAWGSSWGGAWGAIEVALAGDAVTPGAERGPRYRVRVGRKWLTVDPLDAQSVRAAVVAAQEAAEDAAETRVVAPQRSAGRVVAVQPVSASSVDYAGLSQEAARISEQIRAVYAQALQRELIARLVREQMNEDEDESVLLLLG